MQYIYIYASVLSATNIIAVQLVARTMDLEDTFDRRHQVLGELSNEKTANNFSSELKLLIH